MTNGISQHTVQELTGFLNSFVQKQKCGKQSVETERIINIYRREVLRSRENVFFLPPFITI